MYALMALLTALAEATVTAVSRGVRSRRRSRALAKATPQLAAEVTGHDKGTSDVTGQAAADPRGPLTAPFSGAECAWYRVVVHERFQQWRPGPLGPLRSIRHAVTAEHVSGPLSLHDASGHVTVNPAGALFELGEPTFAEYESLADESAPSDGAASGTLRKRLAALLGVEPRRRHRDMTLGFVVEEWIIREGEGVEAVGRAQRLSPVPFPANGQPHEGDVVIAKPPRTPFIVRRT